MPDRTWVDRYLNLLQLEREPPRLDALTRLCHAQVTRVPFDNVSSILRRRETPRGPVQRLDLEATLGTWERRAGGGVCVDATPTFRRLLTELGYTARPILARISFPGSHQASIVPLDGRDFLVDVANGAPFVEPIRIDSETVLRRAGLGWRFRPAPDPDTLIQDRLVNGDWTPFCYYTLCEASAEDIESAYQRHHTHGESWVVGNLTIVRSTETEVIRLRDDELVRYSDSGVLTQRVAERDLPTLAGDVFGLPELRVLEAVAALRTFPTSVAAG